MDWKKESMELLQQHIAKKRALRNIRERYHLLEDQMELLNNCSDRVPRRQEHMIDSIVEKEQLLLAYRLNKQQVDWVEQGLAALDERERQVLDNFYISTCPCSRQELMEQLCIERSALYDLKDRALRHFTLAMYGQLKQ